MIRAQGKIFFAAGFETTANCLTTLCYNLALNPDIQEKLRNEVMKIVDEHEVINHETIADMHYLEAAIQENLRMYPPVIVQERICKKDVEVKGLQIKKGTYVRVPIYACHHNPDFFQDPEEFRPERFLKENATKLIPNTFNAFSGGPRICLGMRFAMTEMKICMAKLLSKFTIKSCPQTELSLNPGDLFVLNYKEVYLSLVPRE